MKRPTDQAKLLFFALLRSSASALATTGDKTVPADVASAAVRQPAFYAPPNALQNIQLRLATRTDVPSLQRCNIACLPENYNSQFYCTHLRKWPDLALVAEHVDEEQMLVAQQRPFGGFPGVRNNAPEPKIVAYVLGKVEAHAEFDYDDPTNGQIQQSLTGHVTSLAVSHEYRRQGLAQALMDQLHFHMQHNPHGDVTSCGLHVRASNEAACRLYENDGYSIIRTIPTYYQDGEDAYYMTKPLPQPQINPSMFGRACWVRGPPQLRLPRRHQILLPSDQANVPSPVNPASSSSPEMLTGTM